VPSFFIFVLCLLLIICCLIIHYMMLCLSHCVVPIGSVVTTVYNSSFIIYPWPYVGHSHGGIVFVICWPYHAIGHHHNFILSLTFIVTMLLSWTIMYLCDLTDHRSSLIFSSLSLFNPWQRYVSTILTFSHAFHLLWSLVHINHSWTFIDWS